MYVVGSYIFIHSLVHIRTPTVCVSVRTFVIYKHSLSVCLSVCLYHRPNAIHVHMYSRYKYTSHWHW